MKTPTLEEHYKNYYLEDIKYFCEYDLEWKTEQWKTILGFEKYQISDLGRVKSLYRERKIILKSKPDYYGYLHVSLYGKQNKTCKIHKLVAIMFLGHTPSESRLVVNHKDFNRQNNKVYNLELVTNRENTNQKHLLSKSKYTGVSFKKQNKKWVANIYINKKKKHLGYFINEYDAHLAYEKALKETIQEAEAKLNCKII